MATIETKVDIDAEDLEKQEEQQQETLENKQDTNTVEVDEEESKGSDEQQNETEDNPNSEKVTEDEADSDKVIDDSVQQLKKSEDEASKTLSDKGIDYDALTKEYDEKGALSAETYKKLADAGFPKTVVDTYIKGIEATAEGYVQAVYAAAGGAENYAKIQRYVESKGSDAVNTFNDAVSNGSLATVKMLINGIQAEMKLRNGTAAKSILGKGSGVATAGYSTEADMVKAMDDPRYGVDDDYTENVTKRLSKSKFISFGRY